MDVGEITSIISTIGFPIVCCLACFWKINDQDNKHKEEMNTVTKAIENNTLALQHLTDIMTKSGVN